MSEIGSNAFLPRYRQRWFVKNIVTKLVPLTAGPPCVVVNLPGLELLIQEKQRTVDTVPFNFFDK